MAHIFKTPFGVKVDNLLKRLRRKRRPHPTAQDWYDNNTCPACGRVNNTGKLCQNVTRCKLCGAVQCQNPGGTCKLCGVGLLAGYYTHDDPCDYAGCDNEGVARGKRGKKRVCWKHARHQYGEDIPSDEEVQAAMHTWTWKEAINEA